MLLKGKTSQRLIQKDSDFNQENAISIFLKNQGNATVNFGLLKLLPNQSHIINTGTLILDKKNIEIRFEQTTATKELFIEVVRLDKTDCKN